MIARTHSGGAPASARSLALVVLLAVVLLSGCGSTQIKGTLNYPGNERSTVGDTVSIWVEGDSYRGATVVVKKGNKWAYNGKESADVVAREGGLAPLTTGKGNPPAVLRLQARKAGLSTLIPKVRTDSLPKGPIELIYEGNSLNTQDSGNAPPPPPPPMQ